MEAEVLGMEEVTGILPTQYFTELDRLLETLDARPKRLHSPRGLSHRGTLGDFMSITCFRGLFGGLEDLLGTEAASVVFLRAGRLRGQSLVEDWGVGDLTLPVEKLAHLLDAAFGHDGTRLCQVRSATRVGENLVVEVAETLCSAAEAVADVRPCSFTLGAIWGALEALTGQRYLAQQTGHLGDQFTFTPL